MSASDRSPVMGFTEAKLFMVLAFLMLALYAATRPERPSGTPRQSPAQISADSLSKLYHSLAEEQRRIALQRDSLARQRHQIAAQADSLRRLDKFKSELWPDCAKRGLARGALFTVTVLDVDRFSVRGEELSLSAIAARTETVRQEAKRIECRHALYVRPAPALLAKPYDRERQRLGALGFRLWAAPEGSW